MGVGGMQTTEYHSEFHSFQQQWASLQRHFFTLNFGVSLNSAFHRFIIPIYIGVPSFLTHYPVRISAAIQHDLFSIMCFQSVPFILFLSGSCCHVGSQAVCSRSVVFVAVIAAKPSSQMLEMDATFPLSLWLSQIIRT